MAPKIRAACSFVELTGKTASIGSIAETPALVRGEGRHRSRRLAAGLRARGLIVMMKRAAGAHGRISLVEELPLQVAWIVTALAAAAVPH
jgi:hypothetical protein